MIPDGVNLDDLALQLEEDSVAFGPFVPSGKVSDVEPGLIDAVTHAGEGDFGSLGVVVLEHTPAHAPDLRDVAQDLLLSTGMDTIIVRTPESGAVVSDVHSRAALEQAQYPLLGNPDLVGGVNAFVGEINGWTVSWTSVLAVILVVLALTALAVGVALRSS